MAKKKKMAFYEIDRGKWANEVQEAFEKAQLLAMKTGRAAKVKMEIVIKPPDKEQPTFTPVTHSYQLIEPAIKSPEIEIVNNDGVLVRDAQEPLEQLKLEMK